MEQAIRSGQRFAFLLAWVPYCLLVHRLWFVCDDAYISFRFMRNWGSGLGLRYDPVGEPLEGYSNFLLVVVGAFVQRLGGDIELWVPVVSWAAGSWLLWTLYRVALRRFGAPTWIALIAIAACGWCAPFAVWSTSGLETMPYALLFFLLFERLILRKEGVAPISAGVLAVLLGMTRPEGIYWALLLGAMAAASRRLAGDRYLHQLATYLAVVVIGYGSYSVWRYSFYGEVVAQTVSSKMGFSGERLWRGSCYVAVQYLTTLFLFVVIPGAWVALRKARRAVGIAVILMPLGFASLAILVGGDFMTFGRFLLPCLAFDALLLVWILQDLAASGKLRSAWLGGAFAILLAALPAFDLHLVPTHIRARFHFRQNTLGYRSEYAQWEFMRSNGWSWRLLGEAIREVSEPGQSIVRNAFGAFAYASDLKILDGHGFVTPGIAQAKADYGEARQRSAGHDAPVPPSYFVEHGYDPDILGARLVNAARPELVSKTVQAYTAMMFRPGDYADRYVFDFRLLAEPIQGDPHFLVWWHRYPDRKRADDVWDEAYGRLNTWVRTARAEQIELSIPAGPPTGLPAWARTPKQRRGGYTNEEKVLIR